MEVNTDDIVIKSNVEEEMLVDIKETLDGLRTIIFKLNPKKCSFGVEEGIFSGYLITKQGIKANPLKVKAILDLQPPKSISEIQNPNRKLVALNPKWAIELGEHEIEFKGRNPVKGRILADFLAETPSVKGQPKSAWKLFTDGASSSHCSGAGLILVSSEGKEYTYALRFSVSGQPGQWTLRGKANHH
ncbi:hypothetical protein Tco_0138155 [Tanacetum coccineum]